MDLDDQLRHALRTATPQPEVSIDVEEVRRGARRRRRRLLAGSTASAAAATLLTVGAWTLGSGPNGESEPAEDPTPSLPLRTDCPAVLDIEIATTADYPDFVMLDGRTYLRSADTEPGQLGPAVARVTCTIADLSPPHDRHGLEPYREGNAAYLPIGTYLYRVEGRDCHVAAVIDGETSVYVAKGADTDCTRAPATSASTDVELTRCDEVPPVPANTEIDMVHDPDAKVLTFSYLVAGTGKDASYTIDYTDSRCRDVPGLGRLIDHALETSAESQ